MIKQQFLNCSKGKGGCEFVVPHPVDMYAERLVDSIDLGGLDQEALDGLRLALVDAEKALLKAGAKQEDEPEFGKRILAAINPKDNPDCKLCKNMYDKLKDLRPGGRIELCKLCMDRMTHMVYVA